MFKRAFFIFILIPLAISLSTIMMGIGLISYILFNKDIFNPFVEKVILALDKFLK